VIRILLFVGAGLIAVVLCAFVLKDKTWECSAGVSFTGSPNQIEAGSEWISGAIIDSRTMMIGSGSRRRFNLGGNMAFKFRYTGDVSNVRLWSGSQLVYDGPPIQSYSGAVQPLDFDFQWNGKQASIEILDSCSLTSFWQSYRGS
jgi:hypothetical protein